jgi:hypothetical protein
LDVPDPETREDTITEEIRLIMTPRTLKMTQMVLTKLVETPESTLGEIPASPIPAANVEDRK